MTPNGILKAVKEASPFDLFLISFLLLPFITKAWLDVLSGMDHPPVSQASGLSIVLVAYVIGVILTLIGNSRSKKRELAKDKIIAYLNGKNFTMMSFDRVRKNINPSYEDTFLLEVINTFTDELRTARLKGGRQGVAKSNIASDTINDEG